MFQTYDRTEYGAVISFEFLLPLTQEGKLRRALDDLFYVDTVEMVLEELGASQFEEWRLRQHGESAKQYRNRLAREAGDLFGGYSISHVAGRFRAAELITRRDAGDLFARDQQYLVDETTALVRFIVPIPASRTTPTKGPQFVLPLSVPPEDEKVQREINFVRALFFCLFVEALIRYVTGEDQIWLIEESPLGRRLHMWQPE